MKNLDQIRAHNALLHKDRIANSKGGGDAISGFPMLVLTDGILAALAFSAEEKEIKPQDMVPANDPSYYLFRQEGNGREARYFKRKNPGEYTVARAIADHLQTAHNRITTATSAAALLVELSNGADDTLLRRATAEALAFLNFLKRFVA